MIDPALHAQVDEVVAAAMTAHHIPGLSLAIARVGVPLLATGYGLANVELAVPSSAESVYEIASVTKVFTATAVLLLAREGSIRLDGPIRGYLPDLPPAWDGVTVRHLLRHTSGVPNYTDVAAYWKTTRLDISRDAILALVLDLPLDFPPGSNWSYSNTGYYLLGLLLERLEGQSYGEILTRRIFVPLGMAATRVNDPAAVVTGRASGYTWEGETLRNVEYYSPSGTYAAGALLSTVADLVRWDAALYTDAILPQDWLQQMWQADAPATTNEERFGFRMGLGWFLFEHQGRRVLRHNGNIKGFSSEMARFSDDQLTFIVCYNLDNGGSPHLLINDLAALFLPV